MVLIILNLCHAIKHQIEIELSSADNRLHCIDHILFPILFCNQKPGIERQTIQWPQEKEQKDNDL